MAASEKPHILIADDQRDVREALRLLLKSEGWNCTAVEGPREALDAAQKKHFDVALIDLNYTRDTTSGAEGLELLRELKTVDEELPVVVMTAWGTINMAVEAMRIGAFDFLEKPFNPDRMTELAKRATQARRMTLNNRALRRELSDGSVLMKKLVGSSPVMERLREDILDLGQADSHVLIDGETGTGKTLVAHALHAVGPRAGRKFVTISCAAWSEDQLAAKVFGPGEDGAIPLVEEARGGTLCLEDIEALSHPLQSRLLAVINDQGAPPETRIIAICNGHAPDKTLEDELRPDLFYRLGAMTIICPPLRTRGEDILTLFTRSSEQFAEEYGCEAPQVTAQEAAQLLQGPWRGNVRQLVNISERAVLQNRRGSGSIASLLMADNEAAGPALTTEGKPLKDYVEAFERMLIDNTMRRHKGSITSVMDELCLPRRTLNEKMAKYGLQRQDYVGAA